MADPISALGNMGFHGKWMVLGIIYLILDTMTDICRWNFQMYFNDENVLSVIDIQLKFVYGIHFNISLS